VHVASIRDITEQKQQHDTLRLFKTVMDTSQEAIAISDASGQLVYINPAHQQLFGRRLEETRGGHYRDFYPEESREVLDQQVGPALARHEGWEGELEADNAAGERFPLWERADSIHDADGTLRYAFGIMHDVSERKRALRALEEAHDLLEQRVAERTAQLRKEVEEHERTETAARSPWKRAGSRSLDPMATCSAIAASTATSPSASGSRPPCA
jgi:PAS domain S-box-containing protein